MAPKEAQVVDILRCFQRDDLAIRAIEDNVTVLAKSLGTKQYRTFSKFISPISSIWYYYITSCNKLQTLGEEYTNILRLTDENVIPTRFGQLYWLVMYIGGESLFNRFVLYIEAQIKASEDLREEAKEHLLRICNFWHLHRKTFKTLHKALFYLNGNYYSFAHRLAGIKYVILRDWLQDTSFIRSFHILGNISLLYGLFELSNKLWNSKNEEIQEKALIPTLKGGSSIRVCIVCNEERKNPAVTPCGHIFCWNCIHESLLYQHKCPLCREEVEPSRVIFLQNYI